MLVAEARTANGYAAAGIGGIAIVFLAFTAFALIDVFRPALIALGGVGMVLAIAAMFGLVAGLWRTTRPAARFEWTPERLSLSRSYGRLSLFVMVLCLMGVAASWLQGFGIAWARQGALVAFIVFCAAIALQIGVQAWYLRRLA